MAIVKMKKIHLLVLNSDRENLLRELQIFRNIQFEDVKDVEDFSSESLSKFEDLRIEDAISKIDDEISRTSYVIDLISKYTPEISGIKSLIEGLPNYTFEQMEEGVAREDFDKDYSYIKDLGDKLSAVESRISRKKEIYKELEPLESFDISTAEMSKIKRFDCVIGSVSSKLDGDFVEAIKKLEGVYFEKIGNHKEEDYYFIISEKESVDPLNEAFRIGNFNKIRLDIEEEPRKALINIELEISELEKERSSITEKLGTSSRILKNFKLRFDYLSNLRIREIAKGGFMNTKRVSALSGYCPDFEISRLEKSIKFVCGDNFFIEYEDVNRNDEDVPILLKNNRFARIFENITSTYALPKYNEVDPTPLYAPIYALFFGMMSADVGYGVVLFLLTTLGLRICNFTPDMKKNVKFFQLLGVSTAIWGFLYGSYFGASIPGMWRLFDLSTQFMTILVISIIMGGIHLYYGLAIKAYMQIRDGLYLDMFFDVISWYIVLTSIIALLLSLAGVISSDYSQISKYGMYLGLILLLLGGARASEGNIAQRIVAGLYNIYGISSYIGDFVSYSRLMALGMSGGYIAFSVNMIASMVWGKTFLGYIAAIVILIFFHAFNLFLSCLGAYVHSLRLIYVEFFGKFYEGGGKAFRVFRNKSKYINLDRHFED